MMLALALILAIAGFGAAIIGAIRLHRGRMREDPSGSGLYTVPTSDRTDLALTITGACCGLAGAVVGTISS